MGIVGTPKLTALTCMYEKPPEVVRQVLTALHDQADDMVVVLDRPTGKAKEAYWAPEDVQPIILDGPPGWRSPCISWNAGLQHVTGDALLIVQGDVVLTPGSVDHARKCLSERPAAYFGMVLESEPDKCRGAGHAGPVLCSSTNQRPLTYLLAVPTQAVKDIGGWDEAFQVGVWYEDDDFTARLWKHGLDFVFDDKLSGIHQSHARGYYSPLKVATNLAIFLQKHGAERYFDREIRSGRIKVEKEAGRTIWKHA